MTRALEFVELKALNPAGKAVADAPCPLCGPDCRSPANRRRTVLRIWDDGSGFLTYSCARCPASGWARDDRVATTAASRPPRKIEPENDRSELARFLWEKSLPVRGTLAETYLRSRGCFVDETNLRFLAARGEHPPAMIARFGSAALAGVHLTRLAADGSAKAGTDKDKIMLGQSMGQPIILVDNQDRGELLIAEGIEDALSLSEVTGWSAWAAGSASRIPSVLAKAHASQRIYLAVDDDPAGRRALSAGRQARPDLVALRLGHVLGSGERMDANKALQTLGPQALLAAIEWCDAQAQFAHRSIGFSHLQDILRRSGAVIRAAREPEVLAA